MVWQWCGSGVVEIKCPFCARDEAIDEHNIECLQNSSGTITLKTNHAYYYQVQTQIYVCDVTYADFVVWTKKNAKEPHIERILPNPHFFLEKLDIVNRFYKQVILPNILAKTFLAPLVKSATRPNDTCFCKEPSKGEMLQCKSGFCKIGSYHLTCMKLQKAPKRYVCPPCRTVMNTQKREKQKESRYSSN